MDLELDDTERMLRDTFRGWFTRELEPQVPAMERGELLPYPLMREMHQALGLDAMLPRGGANKPQDPSPAAASGLDANVARYARTTFVVEMARVSPSFTLSYGASTGLFAANVMGKGSPEQIERWALPVLRCKQVGAWGLTEPEAGSDALRGMRTTARRDGDSWVLSGSKTFITNAPFADVFLIYARIRGGELDGAIQPFIVERSDAGLSTGPPMRKMGMRGSPTGEIFLDEVRIPADRLLGGGVRQRDHVKSSLAVERGGLSVISYGIAERCFEIARDYAKSRRQFGEPIANFQMIQQRLARMWVAISNSRRIVYADWLAGRPVRESLADVCAGKLYCAEMGTFVAFEAIHIMAGNGYMEEYAVERLARDAKLIELGGGTTEIQILTIARELLA
ncbi:MAG TPA: acyl-CoA dehydrogenase family protein [Candidatus Binatia bacterium]|jgi:alkylation response protein AidB-like acyl-CoA dehydrogenase|nr:acyl-CoA dehydrogenase family protein [Candidatus Binatia bacterium]